MFWQWVPGMRANVREWPSADGHSYPCCTVENLVVLEWQNRACGAPWRQWPVHIARQDTAVPSQHQQTRLVYNQPARSTQPGHPSVGRCSEYQPKGSDAVWLELPHLLMDQKLIYSHVRSLYLLL